MKSSESTVQLEICSEPGAPRPLSDALVAELRRRVVTHFYDQARVTEVVAQALMGTRDKGRGTGATD